LSAFWVACGLGLAYCAAPGAVNTEALRRGLNGGFWPGAGVQFGALAGDLGWAVIGLTGMAVVFHIVVVRALLAVAGATFLLRLAWLSALQARRADMPSGADGVERRHFATGLVFSVANPFGIAFWGGVGGSLIPTDPAVSEALRLGILLAGFATGAVAWCLGMSLAVATAQRLVGAKTLRVVHALSAVALGYFALDMLWATWHSAVVPALFSNSAQGTPNAL